jgi:hypothetical protein
MARIVIAAVVALAIFIGAPLVCGIIFGAEAVRDTVIIIWGILTLLAVLFFILWLLTMITGVRGLIKDVKTVVQDDVRPLIATSRESANNVTGTTRFVSDTVVQPIIRVYGIVAGIRRGFDVFTGLTGRGRGGKTRT